MNDDDLHLWSGLYATDALTADERARYEEHLAGCPDCRAEVAGFHDTAALLASWPDTADGRQAHPTPDHWLPLIYAYAATDDADEVRFPTVGFDLGSLSMRNIAFG